MRLERFDLPARWNDFPKAPDKIQALREAWTKSVRRWTDAAILGNPWTALNDRDRTYYFNPLTVDIPQDAMGKEVSWKAFPNRIIRLFPNASERTQWSYADNGPPDLQGRPYQPAGPRGWQDEYCEWSVQRDPVTKKIRRVDFTCETPEYWFNLWTLSPERVLELYQELVSRDVRIEDLYLRDTKSQPVIERETGRPAYDPLNKWNNSTSNGVVHLISPPNTLSAEIYLAAAAALLRAKDGKPVTDRDALLACSLYGTPFRNSDPLIGVSLNELVRTLGVRVTLKDPVGLYIQQPDFSRYQLPPTAPPDAQPSQFWKLVRGQPGFGLHAVFEVPEEMGFTVSDITIDGSPIEFGSQIATTFQISLTGLGIPSTLPPQQPQPCVAENTTNPAPLALVLQDFNLFAANSRSTSAPRVEQGSTVSTLVLLAEGFSADGTVQFSGQGVKVRMVDFQPEQDGRALMRLEIQVAADAPLGDRALVLTSPGGTAGLAMPGMLEVVPTGTLGRALPLSLISSQRRQLAQGREFSLPGLTRT